MKTIDLTPKKEAFIYFGVIVFLLYQHIVILNTDMKAWFLMNFYISGLISTFCLAKGLKAIKKTKEKRGLELQ